VWTILGITVQRQIGDHHSVALREALDDRLPLAVGEQAGVKQRQRWTGAELAIGDSGAVAVVVKAKPHRGCLAPRHASIVWRDRTFVATR
jgi:hypothetical protein